MHWNYISQLICLDQSIHQAATGFLLTYVQLIRYQSDLNIAQTIGLVNKTIAWQAWQTFRAEILHHVGERDIHDRFEYGELRLNRLNQIFRKKGLGLTYFTIYRDYTSYFGDNYMWLVALFSLVSVALSAMQVMTSLDDVPLVAVVTSYRFAVATLFAIAGSCATLFFLWLGLYVYNWCLIFVRRGTSRRWKA